MRYVCYFCHGLGGFVSSNKDGHEPCPACAKQGAPPQIWMQSSPASKMTIEVIPEKRLTGTVQTETEET